MKQYLTFTSFMLGLTAFGQWNIAAGYTYQVDHPAPRQSSLLQSQENPYAQHELTVQGGYITQHNWEFSAGASFLPHEEQYYQDAYTKYSDCGAGGCSSSTSGNRYQADISYAYAGISLSVRKWIGFEKAPWFQLGFGVFQNNDILVSHKESNRQRQSYSSYSVWYDNPNFMDTHTYSESEWEPYDGKLYEMRKVFSSAGAEMALRFRLKGFYFQPSVSFALADKFRTKETNFNWTVGEYPQPMPNVFNTWYGMPAFSCRIGYVFSK